MSIFHLFSKRQKRLRGEVPDVYTYDEIPKPLRVQIVHILREILGNEQQYNCREYGVFSLPEHSDTAISDVFQFLLEEQNCERVMDVIELSFRVIDMYVRDGTFRRNTMLQIQQIVP